MRDKRTFVILACAALAACGPGQDDGETVGYETRRLTIISVNKPKHFAVDVKDEQGRSYSDVARSKHCNGWKRRAAKGRSYDVPFRQVRGADGKIRLYMMERTFNDMLCGRS